MESLRGVAAAIVVNCHLLLTFWPYIYASLRPWSFAYSGRFAVFVFFVLSGFVLSYGFFKSGRPEARVELLASHAIRRYTRLAGPLLFSVFVAYAIHACGLFANASAAARMHETPSWRAEPAIGLTWLDDFWSFKPSLSLAVKEGLFNGFFAYGADGTYSPVGWTMGVELTGSFCVFGFLSLFGSTRNRWLIYLIIIAGFWKLQALYLAAFIVGVLGL